MLRSKYLGIFLLLCVFAQHSNIGFAMENLDWEVVGQILSEPHSVGLILVDGSLAKIDTKLTSSETPDKIQTAPQPYGVAGVFYVPDLPDQVVYTIYKRRRSNIEQTKPLRVQLYPIDKTSVNHAQDLSSALEYWSKNSNEMREQAVKKLAFIMQPDFNSGLVFRLVTEIFAYMLIETQKPDLALLLIDETVGNRKETERKTETQRYLNPARAMALLENGDPRLKIEELKTISDQIKRESNGNEVLDRYIAIIDMHTAFFEILENYMTGRTISVHQNFEQLKKIIGNASAMKATRIEATATSLLSQAVWFQGNKLEEGIRIFEQSITLHLEAGVTVELATAFNNIANLYVEAGRLRDALKAVSEGILITKKFPASSIQGYLYSNLANIYFEIGDHDLSLINAKHAVRLHRKYGIEYSEATAHIKVARAHRYLGNYSLAIAMNQQALDYFDKNRETRNKYALRVEAIKLEMAKIYLARAEESDMDTAIQLIGAGQCFKNQTAELSTAVEKSLPANFFKRNIVKANLFIAQGELEKAAKCLMLSGKMLDKAALGAFPEEGIDVSVLKLSLFAQQGKIAEARKELETLVSKGLTLRRELDSRFLSNAASTRIRSGVEFYVKELVKEFRANGQTVIAEELFELFESSTNLGLKQRRRQVKGMSGNDENFKDVLTVVSRAETKILDSKDDTSKELAVSEAMEAYQLLSTIRQDTDIGSTFVEDRISLIEIQALLAPDELLIRYFVLPSGVVAFFVSDKKFQIEYTKVNRSTLIDSVSHLIDSLSGQSIQFHRHAKKISEYLSLSKFELSDFHRLVIIPDGPIELVPFAAIRTYEGNMDEGFLGNIFQISRTYSVKEYFDDLPIEANIRATDIVVIADPIFESNNRSTEVHPTLGLGGYRNWVGSLSRLRATGDEASSIGNVFRNKDIKIFLREEANRSTFFSKESRSAKLLHIASHAFYDSATPYFVGIAVSKESVNDSGLVSLMQIQSAKFESNLVVVSGCQTSLGTAYASEGLNGLSNGFLAQGANSVISTLWSIPDIPTAKFMKIFYQELNHNGGDSALALKVAKQSFVNSGKYKHPFFWSSFILSSANRAYEKNVFR